MPFEYENPLQDNDPSCVPRYDRSFQHVDWIDGQSVVQAEQSPTDQGFNERFHRIEADLDAAAADAARALGCINNLRAELAELLGEVRDEFVRREPPPREQHDPELRNGWAGPLRCWRDSAGTVHVSGAVTGGPQPSASDAGSSLICVLNENFRPITGVSFLGLTSRRGDVEFLPFFIGTAGDLRLTRKDYLTVAEFSVSFLAG